MLYNSAIKAYLRDVARIPLIQPEEEQELGRRIMSYIALVGAPSERKTPISFSNYLTEEQALIRSGEAAFQRYVEGNLRLVVHLAKNYQKREFELITFIQLGNLGLMRAVEKFDWSKGYKFSTYAHWWIKQFIQRGITNTGRTIRLPIHISDRIDRINRVSKLLTQELHLRGENRKPTVEEIADRAKLKPHEVLFAIASDRPMSSLNVPLDPDEGTEITDLIEAEETYNLSSDGLKDFYRLLELLDYDSKQVLELRYGLTGVEYSPKEISQKLSMSVAQVEALHSSALQKLRSVIPAGIDVNHFF